METKRLFIGTFIDSSLFEYVLPEIEDHFREALSGKWVEIENMHFTYKFLGDTEISLIPKIKDRLSDLLKEYDSIIKIKGIGAFPDLRRPRILFAGMFSTNNIIFDIFREMDSRLVEFGFERETRKFNSHITLIRIKDINQDQFREALVKYKDFDFGSLNGFKVELIESKLTPKGPIYKVVY
jgi:2'-5' RNA ligase